MAFCFAAAPNLSQVLSETMRRAKKIKFFGEVLDKGVWIYVAEVRRYGKRVFFYVGKTGWKQSCEESSPWSRLAAHLDEETAQGKRMPLLYHLRERGVNPDDCTFELSCFGPDLVEQKVAPSVEHEIIQEAEAQLAARIADAGYEVVGNHEGCAQRADEAGPIVEELVAALSSSYLKNLA
jgi:hypothetical protein